MPATQKSAMRTRAQDKSRQSRLDAKARKACVEAVWKRAGEMHGWAECEECKRIVTRNWQSLDLDAFYAGHVHEQLARSLGGDPHDPDGCVLLCGKCHMNGPSGAHRRSVRTV
jgi:hypothetical protein